CVTSSHSTSLFSAHSLLSAHLLSSLFFFNDPAPTEIYTLSLHDALPISCWAIRRGGTATTATSNASWRTHAARWRIGLTCGCPRSEEHTSELQSLTNLVCRLLLEKKKKMHTSVKRTRTYTESTVDRR